MTSLSALLGKKLETKASKLNLPRREQKLVPAFLRAHGFFTYDGKPYPGKASPAFNVPDKFDDDDHLVFREAEFSEWMIDYITSALDTLGYDYYRLPDNDNMTDVPLYERKDWANLKYQEEKTLNRYLVVIPIHVNAQAMGDVWGKARGAAAFTWPGQSYSDIMAERWLSMFHEEFPNWHIFKNFVDGDSDLEARFTVLGSIAWSVLFEIGMQDNREDVALLLRRDIRERIGNVFIKWFIYENKLLLQQ